jgi:predicted transcriptional regulator
MAKKSNSKKVLADNLAKAIEKLGVSRNAIADKAGVSRSQLYDVLAARKAASVDWLEKVAHTLKVETYTLLRPGR